MTRPFVKLASAETRGDRMEPSRLPWLPAFAGVMVISD
jgi:hypothetical protein